METPPETEEKSNMQVSADVLDAPVFTPEERSQDNESSSVHEASEGNATREIEPALMESDDQNSLDSLKADGHVHEGSTCDGRTEEEDEKQLREYWMHVLQTSTSTGEVVEEMVKVLKHRQKTHSLLCPVCGSCFTRSVILRKKKSSSTMSGDRWFPEPVYDGGTMEADIEQEAREEYQDTEACGCLSCFSLRFERGGRFLNQLQADMTPESLDCLPFFFPPYPWGMTQMTSQRPIERSICACCIAREDGSSSGVEEAAALDVREPAPIPSQSDYTCGIGSTILPDYPWGTMPHLSQDGLSLEEVEEAAALDVGEPEPTSPQSDYTCGIGSAILPDYPWGTMPHLSQGWVHLLKNLLVAPWEMRHLVQSS